MEKKTPCLLSPIFYFLEIEGENHASSPPYSVFWKLKEKTLLPFPQIPFLGILGEAGEGLSLIQNIKNFHFRILRDIKIEKYSPQLPVKGYRSIYQSPPQNPAEFEKSLSILIMLIH